METRIGNWGKTISILTVLSLLFTTFIPAASAQGNGVVDENSTEEELNEVAEMYEFIMEEALVKDENGAPIDIDLDKIEEKIGYLPEEYRELKNDLQDFNSMDYVNECYMDDLIITQNIFEFDKRQRDCVADELRGNWGDITGAAFVGGAIDAIAEGKRAEAARLIVRAGARGGFAGIVVSLTWIEIKCVGHAIGG